MIATEIRDLWMPTGLLLGFQVTLFKWRLEREVAVGDKGDITWLIPSDYVNIIGMLSFVFGVVLLPILGFSSIDLARGAFGLGTLLFVGQILGLAGHYELFNHTNSRSFAWFPLQEKITVFIVVFISVVYLILLFLR